jgi:8-oxo-dGTP diphosphatase
MRQSEQLVLPGRYTVVPRTLSFVFHGRLVLLLRGAADKRLWPNRLNGIGGHIEAHEDVFCAARREIVEESGLAVEDLRLCGIVNAPSATPGQGVLMFVFAARAQSTAVCSSPEGTLEWLPWDNLPTHELVDDLPILLQRVLGHAPGRAPFYALYRYAPDGSLRIEFAEEAPVAIQSRE